MKKNTFSMLDENGNEVVYDVLFTFESDETKKNYIVYTDNIYNSNNELQIYINEYNKDSVEDTVNNITDTDEYNKIKSEIDSILVNMKNESDILNNSE